MSEMNAVGYVDLQVNGYAGVDFNSDALTGDALHQACTALQCDGVTHALATIITDSLDLMAARIRRLAALRHADPLAQRIICGIHIEGPFLSPVDGYRGAHPRECIQSASTDAAQGLIDAGGGLVRLVTLAPEMDDEARVTCHLVKQGLLVSAGHTDASIEQLQRAVDAGLSLFTHLGNACPMRGMHRHDNIVQRGIHLASTGALTACFIADGVHVPFFAISNYLRAIGTAHCIVVTDAMAAAGLGPGRHRLGRWEVEVDEHLAAWAPDRSHLVGSAMGMPRAAANLASLGFDAQASQLLLRDNALRLLRA